MADTEKLIYTCRNAMPIHSRACYGAAPAGGGAAAAQARRSLGGAVRLAALPPGAKIGSVAIGCLAVQESLTLWLASPLASRAKAEKVLPALLDIQLPFPVENCIYRLVELRRAPAGALSILVCAARREAVQACLQRYQAQGADPILLDHEGLALWTQSLTEHPAGKQNGPESYRAVIYMADDHATLILGRGGRYDSAHSMQIQPAPAQETTGRPANAKGAGKQTSPDSAEGQNALPAGLAGRIQRILHAALPSGAGVQWLFCGARAAEIDAVNALHRELSPVWPGPLTVAAEPALFLARALCTRALKRGPLRCNLRVRDFTHGTVRCAEDRRARAAALAVLAAGILMMVFSLTSRWLGERRFNGIKAEIAALAGDLAPGAAIPYGRETAEVRKALEKQAPQTEPFLEAFAPSLAVRLAEVVGAGKVSSVRFETLNLRRNSLALTGVTEDWDQCGQLEERLKALGYNVKMDRQEAVAETEVRFAVNAEGGGP